MKKFFSFLAVSMAALCSASAEDYTPWGYYMGEIDNEELGIIGVGVATLRVAIFVPGDGIFVNGKVAGVNVPVLDSDAVTELRAWVTPSLSSNETYAQQVVLTNYANGYNQAVFSDAYTVTEAGCYVGYTITVDTTLHTYGSIYPVIYDPTTKTANSFWIWSSSQFGWQDIGAKYGQACVQALFSELQLSEASAYFGTIQNGLTIVNTETEWPVTVYSDASEAVRNIEYTIDVNGVKETRSADVAIESGANGSGEINVKVSSPAQAGAYHVALTVTKINGKENTMANKTSISTFNNLSRFVARNSLVEEYTGTDGGWCPRGLQGMANLRAEFGSHFIGLAFHSLNESDPMYPNSYITASDLGISEAPGCTIDRKKVMDPYYGTEKNNRFVLQDFEDYCSIPAEVDLTIKSEWVGSNKDSVKIDANVESLGSDAYDIVYVLTADSLTGTSSSWRQANYYNQYSKYHVGAEDLAKFCKGEEFGTSRFYWNYDNVVIASSYNDSSENQAPSIGALAPGASAESTYTLALPTNEVLRAAVDASIDKVYAVAYVIKADGTIAQAVKALIGQEGTASIEEIEQEEVKNSGVFYDLRGRQVSAPRAGQLIIRDGKKMIIR